MFHFFGLSGNINGIKDNLFTWPDPIGPDFSHIYHVLIGANGDQTM